MSKHVKGLILVVMLWIAVFAGFIAMKEYTLREGIEIELATVPVDPRDLLRGDYVILRYPMSTLTPPFSAQVAGARVGSTIYVDFDTTGQQAQPLRATLRKPDKGIFIRGTVESVEPNKVMVTYGIESFFVPEGQGRQVERARGGTLSVRVVVDDNGRAVLTDLLMDGAPVQFK